jgi:hypothetical protein
MFTLAAYRTLGRRAREASCVQRRSFNIIILLLVESVYRTQNNLRVLYRPVQMIPTLRPFS